jgi:hypothetical protein
MIAGERFLLLALFVSTNNSHIKSVEVVARRYGTTQI